MEFLIIGVVSAINLIIIKVKFEKGRIEDAVFDLSMMGLLGFMFAGSYGGMVVAMVASVNQYFPTYLSSQIYWEAFNKVKEEIAEANRRNQ